ncbi:T6SS phospholipase effector Tle1-like catalytic domain-containing protein [Dyella monticola]|uniref:T6SS phospholipase effector Tle1-like catalytic domain-containing protein n=1 Tax=Dyella monticola TaxID=1927958 RepID=UPI0013142366|nr:DUF2235 domain-containing protein [Dyella monticola]
MTIPDPMPVDGYRKLTPLEMMQRQRALTCIRSKESAQCQGQVYATVFFDGTGNNMDWQEPGTSGKQQDLGKHSNIARLFNARFDEPENGFFSYYIPGAGTPFEKIGDHDGGAIAYGQRTLGGIGGYMGADRINWGITRVYNAVHAYITDGALLFSDDQAKIIVNNMSSSVGALTFENSYRRRVLHTWEEKLAAVVQKSQRHITQINVAVFGFSRGAAEARTFTHWLSELLQQQDGGYALAGVPLRIYFMGLFDTVASVGIPDMIPGINGHMAWADGTMHIPSSVEQCVHFFALHEQRACFPLETAANVRQMAYPGMHSDVGGGYLPTEQGKLSQLSQIPLNDMHYEAFKAGVPVLSREDIDLQTKLKADFFTPPDLVKAYNAFWSTCGIGAASSTAAASDFIRQHTHQYLQWRGGLLQRGQALDTRGFYQRAGAKDKDDLRNAQDDFAKQTAALRDRLRATDGGTDDVLDHAVAMQFSRLLVDDPLQPVDATTRELLAAVDTDASLPEEVRQFMDNYVHDSRAGFRDIPKCGLEPHRMTGGYLRYRSVFQNDRDVTKVASTEVTPSNAGAVSGPAVELA